MFIKQKTIKKSFRFHPGSWAVVGVLLVGLALHPGDPVAPPHPEGAPVGALSHQEGQAAMSLPSTHQPIAAAPDHQIAAASSDSQPLAELAKRLPSPKAGPGYTEYPYTVLLNPNDTYYNNQWHLGSIGAPGSWDRWTGGSTTTIAIIDTGFALSHEDLSSKWKLNTAEMGTTVSQGVAPNCTSRGLALDKRCNNIDDDGNGYKDDWRGWDFVAGDNDPQAGSQYQGGTAAHHGTYVSGLAAASSNNAKGVAGVNWGAQILPLQVLDDNGNGYTSEVAEAIEYAADAGVDVINLSLGSPYNDSTVRDKIAYAQNLGVTVVVAAGNEGCNECLTYPANYPEVIAVGASTQSDVRASFSSWGANLDLMAPGAGGICSTTWSASNGSGAYSCSGQGTSFAAPIVSGAAGLIAGRNTALTPAEIRDILVRSSHKVTAMSSSFSTEYGYGRLNLQAALQQLAQPLSLSSASDGTVLSLADNQDIVTVCRGTITSCRLRFVGPASQVVLSPVQSLNQWADTAFQWQPEDFGLTAGTWTMESAYHEGSPSGMVPATITITD